jgi:predicted negative regulator of RcsB-dependent stress response
MTKQELREDPILETLQRWYSWSRRHAGWLAAGLVIVVVVSAGAGLMLRGRSVAKAKAAVELAQARTLFLQGQTAAARTTLEQLLARYGGTPAGLEARLILAEIRLEDGQPEAAEALLRELIGRVREGDPLKIAARRTLAACLEQTGQFDEASRIYEELAGDKTTAAALSDLLNAARVAREAGQLPRASELYARAQRLAEKVARARLREIQTARAEVEALLSQAQ